MTVFPAVLIQAILLMKNITKCLFSLTIAVAFIGWMSTLVLAEPQNPKTAEEYNNRGLARQSSGDLDGAIADYTKALALNPKSFILAIIYNNRANALMGKNDFAAAAADYGSAIQLQPTNFENYYRERFPEDFMFQLTAAEVAQLNRSQIVIGSEEASQSSFPALCFHGTGRGDAVERVTK